MPHVAMVAGGLSAGLSLLGTGLYLVDIRRGSTRPQVVSWSIWAAIALIAVTAHRAEGGRWGLIALGGQALTTLAVAMVALVIGVGGISRANLVALGLAAAGVTGWQTLDDPLAATACVAAADGAGLLAIAPKYWSDPRSETASTYALAAGSGLLAAVAVFDWDVRLLLFPAYYCLGNAVTAALIWLRRGALEAGTAPVARTRPRRRPAVLRGGGGRRSVRAVAGPRTDL